MSEFDNKKEELKNKANDLYAEGKEKATQTYKEVKDKAESLTTQLSEGACDLYAQGKEKIHDLQDCVGVYSDEMIKSIKTKPLTSVLIAGGIGFVLAKLLKK